MLIELSGWSIKAIIPPVFLPLVSILAFIPLSIPRIPSSPSFSPPPLTNSFSLNFLSYHFRTAVLTKKNRPPFEIFPFPKRSFLFPLFIFIRSRYSCSNNLSFTLSETMIFLPLRIQDVEEATLEKSTGGTAESSGWIFGIGRVGKPFLPRLSLTNATQVRLFNAASVRSEAFSQDEWDDWLSLGTNSRKLRFIVARRCLLPGYDTYRSLTHSTNPLPPPPYSFSTSLFAMRYEWQLHQVC